MSTVASVLGNLVIKNLPDTVCFESFTQLLEDLPNYMGVQIPTSVTNIVISVAEPTSSQRNNLWFRLDNAGNFQGLYVYSGGVWTQVFPDPTKFIDTPSDVTISVPSGEGILSNIVIEQFAYLSNPQVASKKIDFFLTFHFDIASPTGTDVIINLPDALNIGTIVSYGVIGSGSTFQTGIDALAVVKRNATDPDNIVVTTPAGLAAGTVRISVSGAYIGV